MLSHADSEDWRIYKGNFDDFVMLRLSLIISSIMSVDMSKIFHLPVLSNQVFNPYLVYAGIPDSNL